MPWAEARYPAAVNGLRGEVRAKAIEIANAMLADGAAEGRAIRMAIAAARRWAARDAAGARSPRSAPENPAWPLRR